MTNYVFLIEEHHKNRDESLLIQTSAPSVFSVDEEQLDEVLYHLSGIGRDTPSKVWRVEKTELARLLSEFESEEAESLNDALKAIGTFIGVTDTTDEFVENLTVL